jgi:hypothetical protein
MFICYVIWVHNVIINHNRVFTNVFLFHTSPKYPVLAEPPAEVAGIVDAIVAHPRYVLRDFCSSNEPPRTYHVCSFRSIVFQIQESVKNPGGDLDCIDGAANLEGQRSAVCIAVVQFYSTLREAKPHGHVRPGH